MTGKAVIDFHLAALCLIHLRLFQQILFSACL